MALGAARLRWSWRGSGGGGRRNVAELQLERAVDDARGRRGGRLKKRVRRRPHAREHVEDVLVRGRLDRADQRPKHRVADQRHGAHPRHAGRRARACEDRLPQLAAAGSLEHLILVKVGQHGDVVLGEQPLRRRRVEVEDVRARAADREHVLHVPHEMLELLLEVCQPRLHPLLQLAADGVALGRAERDVLAHLVDERADRRAEPADAGPHRLDLVGLRRGLLVGEVHQLAQDGVHRLAPLLEDVDERVLRTGRVVVALAQPEDQPRSEPRRSRPVVARARGEEAAQQLRRARIREAGLLHELDDLLDRLVVRRRLRLGGLARGRRQIEGAQLEFAVDAPREDGADALHLLRLGAVGDVAARGLVRVHVLQQPLADLQLVQLVGDARELLAVRRLRRLGKPLDDGGALAVHDRAGDLDLAVRQRDPEEPREDREQLRDILPRHAEVHHRDARELRLGVEVVAQLEARLGGLGDGLELSGLSLRRLELGLQLGALRLHHLQLLWRRVSAPPARAGRPLLRE
mmetsp:Transcript_12838/g.42643  ORF Transcript_12838/g.42643 Transcript_12838/m.42643 type:complete len:520 (+) Transcript_12838:819-2378(+)